MARSFQRGDDVSSGDGGPASKPLGLLLGLRCDARGSSLYNEGLSRGCFELPAPFVMASCLTASAPSSLGWLLKCDTSSANMATSTFSSTPRRRPSMNEEKKSGDRTDLAVLELSASVPVDLHFYCFIRVEVAKPLRICIRGA